MSYDRQVLVGMTRSDPAVILVEGYIQQKLEDVITGLESAWAFFGGVPRYLVIDNFPAAVAGPDPLHPHLTRGFLEYSQHRGFVADPHLPSGRFPANGAWPAVQSLPRTRYGVLAHSLARWTARIGLG